MAEKDYFGQLVPLFQTSKTTFYELIDVLVGEGSTSVTVSELYTAARMLVVLVTHNVQFSKNLSRNLFCDARLTKDGVALIPVHKIVLASFSSKLKRMFESQDQRNGLTVVPVVDFPNLKRVIDFIYNGRITLHSKEDLDDFVDALSILKVVQKS